MAAVRALLKYNPADPAPTEISAELERRVAEALGVKIDCVVLAPDDTCPRGKRYLIPEDES